MKDYWNDPPECDEGPEHPKCGEVAECNDATREDRTVLVERDRTIAELKTVLNSALLELDKARLEAQAAKLYPSEAEKGLIVAQGKIAQLEREIAERNRLDRAVPGSNVWALKRECETARTQVVELKREVDRLSVRSDCLNRICKIVCEDCDR